MFPSPWNVTFSRSKEKLYPSDEINIITLKRECLDQTEILHYLSTLW